MLTYKNNNHRNGVPLLSICCFTYNQEEYVKQTLESFLMQRTSFPIEIIVHDDASNDSTRKIIQEYASSFPHIIKPILQKENKFSTLGINFIFEFVTSQAIGKYIAFCAGDDFWIDPLKLQKQVDFLESNHDYGIVHTKAVKYIQEKKEFHSAHGYDVNSFEELLIENTISVPTVCLRSNLLKEYFAEVKPREHLKWTAEDFPMWLWFIHHSKIKYMKDITTAYRERLGSISHIRDVCKRLHFSEGIYDIVDYYLTTYPGVKNESKIRARYYSAMISMYFLTKSWEGIKKSAKIFYHSNDWLNLFWIGITLPFFYSPYLIRASYCVRGEVFNLFNIYPIKK